MTYYIQISTIDWTKDKPLFEDTLSTLEKLCDIQNGYMFNEPVSKFGWTFIDMVMKADFHMSLEHLDCFLYQLVLHGPLAIVLHIQDIL